MRKSIFDIAAQSIDMPSEVDRLVTMATKENTLCEVGLISHTLFQYVEEHCFPNWKQRHHFLNVRDFLHSISFDDIVLKARVESESLLTLIELIYNFWFLAYQKLCSDLDNRLDWSGNYLHLREVMDDILADYNHVAYCDEDEECVLVVEDKPEVTAVAEIVSDILSKKIIRYNHRSLKGNIEKKKEILLSMGNEYEPKRKLLKQANAGTLESTIFQMLNKLNLRHNNRDENDKGHYCEYVAKMADDELEAWYDELYQLMLYAFLLLDNVDRLKKTGALVGRLSAGKQ